MKKQVNLIARMSRIAGLAFLLFAAQAPDVFAQLGYGHPCLIGSKMVVERKTPQCTAAKSAFEAAAPIVIGNAADENVYGWILSFALDQRPQYKGKFDEGLKFIDAVNWLKDRISQNDGADDRALSINNAFQEVYGRDSEPIEQAKWEPQVKEKKAWYATIVGTEREKLNKDENQRRLMINRAYYKAMGRNASDGDLQYWLPRGEHFRSIVEAIRIYLYSENGATDLVETVSRALKAKNSGAANNEQIKKAMEKFTPNKLIYAEMLAAK